MAVVACPQCGKKNRVPKARAGVPQCAVCHAPLPWLVDAAEDEFDQVVGSASLPVLVDVWAPWCAPCKVMEPLIQEVARNLAGRIKVVKVNADDAPRLSDRFGVRGIPTMLLLDQGRVVDRRVGALPREALRQWVDQAIARAAA